MFRNKKKKIDGALRKRKDLSDEAADDDEEQKVAKAEAMDVDDGDESSVQDGNTAPDEAGDDGGDEDAVLARMRSRAQRSKAKASGAMSFSSKAKKISRVLSGDNDETMSGLASTGGGLSFDEDLGSQDTSKRKKLRIRPNLRDFNPTQGEDIVAEDAPSRYSRDALESLIREQKVLLRRPSVAVEGGLMDLTDDATTREMSTAVDEESKGDPVDEEFIPLNSQIMQEKRHKKRVTFGVHNEEFYPPKTAEVEEPVPESDDETEEQDVQSKQWEEELMRRGGGRYSSQQQRQAPRSDRRVDYPTRKAVPCSSLSEVMRLIQRKLVAGSTETERVTRELTRLEAEMELIKKKQAEQHNALVVSSAEFEYFQVLEDYVKGLSFCLREKIPIIEAEEAKRRLKWSDFTAKIQEMRSKDIRDEILLSIRSGKVSERQFVNLPAPLGDSSIATVEDNDGSRLKRFHNRYESLSSPADAYDELDVFSDAVDDINSLKRVYNRFREWKNKFPDIYKNAYADLALVKLYAPYIRAELINWDPLATASSTSTTIKRLHGVSSMDWFEVLRQHQPRQRECELEEPVSSLLREVVISRVADATSSRFDAFSSVHTQSVIDLIEDLSQMGALKYVDHGVEDIISNLMSALTNAAKQLPLLALGDQDEPNDRVHFFAQYLLGEFNMLLENTLTLFVALPNGALHERGFNGVMQLLHQLLAYVNHCKHLNKTSTFAQVQRIVQQLSSSSFMQGLLSRSTREQFEFQRILQLLTTSVT